MKTLAAACAVDSLVALSLKSRRPEVYARGDKAPTQNVDVRISLQEHYKRLERLGLPQPMIEGDYEEDDETDRSRGT